MKQILALLPTILIVIPIPLTISLYYLLDYFVRSKWKIIHILVELTAMFYVIATTILLNRIISVNITGYMIICMLLLLGIILIVQRKRRTEVMIKKGIKIMLRINFILFFLSYLGILIYLIVKSFV